MKKILTTLVALMCFFLITQAQNTTNNRRNLNEIRANFLKEFDRLEKNGQAGKEDDGLMKQFKRWEYITSTRVLPGGYLPNADIQWREWQNYQATHSDQFEKLAAVPNWQQVGTNAVPALGGGAGRINVIRFAPANTNIIYIGAAGAGVWKSLDGGATWNTTSDMYPVTGVADIAIYPGNSNIVYVATGDGYGYEFGQNEFWGGVYSAGIMRSTDAGATWARVGNLEQTDKNIIQRLLVSPLNSKILLMARRDGIYFSKNSGTSWQLASSAHCYDMEYNAANPTIVYAGGEGVVYKSVDGGRTWASIKTGLGAGRMSLEVSASDANVIYALSGSTFSKSTDGGATWVNKSFPSGAGFYGYYDLMLACSGANSDYLVAGGLTTVKSINGGTSWTTVDNWSTYTAPNYAHADKHFGIFYPGSTTNILIGTDGGIFKTTNGGTNWSDLSNGMAISQIYRLGTTPQNTNLVISGWQDNGCNKWDGTNWTRVYGADGMEAAIDYTNQNTMYEAYQNGGLQRSLNGGTSWTYIAPSSGFWVTPFVIDPVNNSRLYYGSTSLYKSENKGTSWSTIGGTALGDYAQAIAVAPSNTNIVYVASWNKIMKADIAANTAINITGTLPTATGGITYIAVSNTDPNKVWISMAGYTAGNKVWKTVNGGTTWTNVSGTLPNLPVNTIVYQNGSSGERVFVGTDIGVYTIDNAAPDWFFYNKSLPNVMIHELEINYTSNKLVAATYGRGIWQVDLPAPSPAGKEIPVAVKLAANVFPNPTNGVVNIEVQNATADVLVDVYKITGDKVASYRFNAASAKNMRINIGNQPFGNYIVRIKSGNAEASKEVHLFK